MDEEWPFAVCEGLQYLTENGAHVPAALIIARRFQCRFSMILADISDF
jgi:hypothetical protein